MELGRETERERGGGGGGERRAGGGETGGGGGGEGGEGGITTYGVSYVCACVCARACVCTTVFHPPFLSSTSNVFLQDN